MNNEPVCSTCAPAEWGERFLLWLAIAALGTVLGLGAIIYG